MPSHNIDKFLYQKCDLKFKARYNVELLYVLEYLIKKALWLYH